MKPSFWKYEDPAKQTVHFRGKVLEYDGTKVVTVHSCEKVHVNKFKAIEDAKKLIKTLKNKKMLWSNLKAHKCPKCGGDLTSEGLLAEKYSCTNKKCDFSIGAGRYDQIVRNEKRKETSDVDPDERLSELNNL